MENIKLGKFYTKNNKLNTSESSLPSIMVQGDTCSYYDGTLIEQLFACKRAAINGYKILLKNRNALEAVEAALWWLECDEFLNCGYGSSLNETGNVQMNACIANGNTSEFGSVEGVSEVEHPISLAKYVLENYPNNIIVGENTKKLAKYLKMNVVLKENMISPRTNLANNFENLSLLKKEKNLKNKQSVQEIQSTRYFFSLMQGVSSKPYQRYGLGTIGCIAWDGYTMAAGITTGSLNKGVNNTIANAALFGCRIFVNENLACLMSGEEDIMTKMELAKNIVKCIEEGHCPQDVLKVKVNNLAEESQSYSGGIALHKNGCWGSYFTSATMPYVHINNKRIVFGTNLEEKQFDLYVDPDKEVVCSCTNPSVIILYYFLCSIVTILIEDYA
ncbi:isoaspartyl peptidase/L-asparaginase-like [Prorops nasuta]|uniref:isoaspartyl peptidase/L-asparaginase-like n=1 Tax=Prorops nasuta TaxID=863751 RepID=UPI0034D0226F